MVSPSVRGSGLKCPEINPIGTHSKSPSVRGSGLKYTTIMGSGSVDVVSLCKREWIEISDIAANQQSGMSPSARGSGLK